MLNKFVVIRTYSAGVHYGTLKSHSGKEAVLTDARRLWYWKGAFTLSAVAMKGVEQGSKISTVVPEILLTEVIEIIPTTQEAQDNLVGFPVYEG